MAKLFDAGLLSVLFVLVATDVISTKAGLLTVIALAIISEVFKAIAEYLSGINEALSSALVEKRKRVLG